MSVCRNRDLTVAPVNPEINGIAIRRPPERRRGNRFCLLAGPCDDGSSAAFENVHRILTNNAAGNNRIKSGLSKV